MTGTTEIRWHARAGQGAKTASQVLALALLRGGHSVQSFPEYGPERRGAPLRAFTRVSDRPLRRHDTVEEPDVIVVLEPSLAREPSVLEGLREGGLVIVNGEPPAGAGGNGARYVPAERLGGAAGANVVMLGAVARALGEPSLAELQRAVVDQLVRKVDPEALRQAAEEGYRWET